METGDWISVVALVLSIMAMVGSAYNWYEARFRYSEVLSWSLDSIRSMQRLALFLTEHSEEGICRESEEELSRLAAEISTNIEVGRVFFKNTPGRGSLKDWGKEKPKAY